MSGYLLPKAKKAAKNVTGDKITPFYEQQGSSGHKITYTSGESAGVIAEEDKRPVFKSVFEAVQHAFYQVFLPYGYPESVSDDYVQYQIWDTLQAFCSTITGIFATKEILKGVGVGDEEATALAATITWILKDGSGMIGRIVFAWWKGSILPSCDIVLPKGAYMPTQHTVRHCISESVRQILSPLRSTVGCYVQHRFMRSYQMFAMGLMLRGPFGIINLFLERHRLDADCKQWRIVADVLNDVALFLEFLLPVYQSISIYILCLTSVMKSVVGVAGSATRASITQHQAINRNTADVSAKDGSQETCVNLLGSIFGLFLLTSFEGRTGLITSIFVFFIALHIIANVFAVRSLVFKQVNKTRLLLILKTYLKFDTVAPPLNVNKAEPLCCKGRLNAKMMCGFDIKVGVSVKHVMLTLQEEDIANLMLAFTGKDYLVLPDIQKRVMYITLDKEIAPTEVIAAYFHAVWFGIALCIYNKIDLNIDTKRHLHHAKPIERLSKIVKTFDKEADSKDSIFSLENMVDFQQFFSNEVKSFFTALIVNGWDTEIHSLEVGQWRTRAVVKED